MDIRTDMTKQEVSHLNYKVDAYNKKLKEDQKIVSKSVMEQADFMKLLITQLRTQDPTKPLDDKEFIGQMAQFTSLKQMNEMTENMKGLTKEFAFTKAVNLVNKTVSWVDENEQVNTGLVSSVKIRNGETYLNIGDQDVPLGQIREVSDTRTAEIAAGGIESSPLTQSSGQAPVQTAAASSVPVNIAPILDDATNFIQQSNREMPLVF